MSISFSGLASGLDTSSWVESLVALKKAKVETYEEEKSKVQTTQETLSKIKAFFTSFRSMLEKVTDAKFGVGSMDIFAQKLANSSDTSILTAAATTEAEEATYDVTVDKLATGTQAVSGFKSMTTIIQSETATLNTKLTAIGVKAGDIGVTVNGTKHTVTIGENDTISNFISKLKNIGVDASYSETSGIFSINLSANAIDDTITHHADGSVGTGIVNALHLESTGGYESADLKISNSETIVTSATAGTKLSELGTIKAGNIEVKANNTSYTIAIDGNTTLASLINNLQSKGIDARLSSDGILEIKDAEIVDSGNTGIISALGLEMDINSKTQTASGLKTVTITTTESAATGATKLSALGTIKNGTIQVKANGSTYTVTIDQNTTLSGLITTLTGKGVDASLSSDGVFTIKNAEIIDSGNTGIIEALGLSVNVNSKTQSSKALSNVTTTTSETAATGSTKISALGTIKNGTIQVKANGSTYTVTIDQNTTLSGLITTLTGKGVDASLSSDGVFTIKNAEIIDSGNTGIIEALGLSVNVNSKTQSSKALSNVTTTTSETAATGSTKISALGTIKNGTIQVKANGSTYTVTIDQNTTLSGLITTLTGKGVDASLSSDGVFTIKNAEIIDSGNTGIIEALGLSVNVNSKTQSSKALSTVATTTTESAATGSTKISALGTIKNGTIQVKANDATYTFTIDQNTTLSGLINSLANKGVSATLDSEGNFSITNAEIIDSGDTGIIKALGLTKSVDSKSQTSGLLSYKTVITTVTGAKGNTKLQELDGWSEVGSDTKITAKSSNGTIATITVSGTTTIDELVTMLNNAGVSASFNTKGEFIVSEGTISGKIADVLGITSGGANTNKVYTNGNILATQTVVYATTSDTLGELGISTAKPSSGYALAVYDSSNSFVAEITVSDSTTIGNIFSELSKYGITGTMSNGAISLMSSNGNFIRGSVAEAMGIRVDASVSQTGSINTSVTTTTPISATSTFAQAGIKAAGRSLNIKSRANDNVVSAIAISSNSQTFQNLFDMLESYGIHSNLYDGYITLTSDDYYVDGDLADVLGIDVVTCIKTKGGTITSSKTYYNTVYANVATKFSIISDYIGKAYGGTSRVRETDSYYEYEYDDGDYTIYRKASITLKFDNNKTSTYYISDSDTFSQMFDWLAQYSIQASMTNGIISYDFSNANIKTISSAYGDWYHYNSSLGSTTNSGTSAGTSALGLKSITPTTTTITSTKGTTATSSDVIYSAQELSIDDNTTLSQLGVGDSKIALNYGYYNQYTINIATSSTIKELKEKLLEYKVNMSINSNNTFSFEVDSDSRIDIEKSSLFRNLGCDIVAHAKSYTSSRKTYGSVQTTLTTTTSSWGGTQTIRTTTTTTVTMSESSKLEDIYGRSNTLGVLHTTVTIINNSTDGYNTANYYFSVNSTTTLGDYLDWYRSMGLDAYISSDGSVTIGIKEGSKIESVYTYDDKFFYYGSGLNGSSSISTTMYPTNSKQFEEILAPINTTVNLSKLGFTTGTINVLQTTDSDGNHSNYMTITESSTVQDFLDFVNKNVDGISASLSGGKITLSTNGKTYITYINSSFAENFKLNYGNNYTYTVSNKVTSVFNNVTSEKLANQRTDTVRVSDSTVLGELGLNEEGTIGVRTGENSVEIITVNSNTTLDSLKKSFENSGIGFSFSMSSGSTSCFKFVGSDSSWITSMSNNLQNVLNTYTTGSNKSSLIGNGQNKSFYTYTDGKANAVSNRLVVEGNVTTSGSSGGGSMPSTIYSNKTIGSLFVSGTGAVGEDTILGAIKKQDGSNLTFDSTGKAALVLKTVDKDGITRNNTINFSKTQTLGSVIETLKNYGIDASIDGSGLVTLSTTELSDFDISGTLGEFLAGTDYVKKYDAKASGLQTKSTTTQTVGATRDTLLSELGVTAGEFYIYKDGVKNIAVISSDETLGSFLDKLSAMGIQAGLINNGSSSSIMLNAQGDTYIAASSASGASNILTKLFNGQTAKGNVSYQGKEVTKSTSTQTVAADRSGLLSAYGVTAGEFYIYNNGNRQTLQISSDETIGSLIDTLANYGLKAELVKNGNSSKIVISGSGDSYIAKSNNTASASNIVDTLFGGASAVVNESSYTGKESFTTKVTATVGATGSTALSSLGVTAGEYYIYKDGVKYTAIISSDETIGSFMDTLKSFGIQAGLINNGSKTNIILSGSGDSYIAKSNNTSGASNIVDTLFGGASAVVNDSSYTGKESIATKSTATVGATESTALSSLGVTAGEFYIYNNGNRQTLQISSDETIGSLIDTLANYGLKAELVKNGNSSKIVISGSGDSYIAKSNNTASASNIVDTLFGGASAVVNESSYSGVESITTKVTATVGATESTALSSLGVTAGEYYIYNNGVKYTAIISSDETIGSFMDTLKSFGIQTGLINNGGSASLVLIGNGNSYIAKSNSVNNASNVVDKLFGTSDTSTSYSYKGSELLYSTVTHTTSATTDSLLSEFDTPWGNTTLKSAGDLVVMVNGEAKTVRISETETFGSLVDKLKNAGIQADFLNGKLYITNAGDLSIIADRTTSSLFNPNANLKLTSKDKLNGFMSSTATVQSTTTIIEEHSASASAYADMDTKLSTLGITSGSLSIYRNGEKALINIEASHTLGDVRSLISKKFSNVDMKFSDDGKLVFYSTDKDVSVELGNTTDTSNFLAVTGVVKTKDGTAESARALYTVNGDSKVMADGIFRRGNVKAGSFFVGTERFEINANTTINDVVSMINNAAGANATAYWDTIDGKLVIKSRSSGAALINIEAGTSDFTDIMGYTTSEWNKDGSLKVSRMNVDTQELGSNAQFRINGTSYTATSNTITSDITKIKGVTLNLNGLTSGSAIKVTVEKDKESVATALSDIVDSYNELMNNVDEAIAKEGALKNQTTLKMIRNQLRSLMTSSDLGATTFRNLSAIGISVEAASASNISTSNSSIINLNFDKDTFFKAYEANPDAVKALLIGGKDNKGIFTNVETLVDNALQSVSGYFAVTESAYNRELTNWNTKITKANKEIDRYKSRLEKKFSSMDLTISNMQQQYSTFLS